MSRFARSTRPLRRLAFFLLLAACGSRTGLFVDDTPELLPADGGAPDGSSRRDGGRLDGDVEEDALPPIDARPPIDAPNRTDCPDAAATLVYLISADFQLYSYDPSLNSPKLIGNIACPADQGATPFSMAVDRKGVAYIHFTDGKIYRVSTATAACVATAFVPGQQGFQQFGMGFATNAVGPTETLYVAGSRAVGNGNEGLARIDVNNWVLTRVGPFVPTVINAELTGTGDGRLFAFYAKNTNGLPPTYIGEIDTATARVLAEKRLDNVALENGWAFAFWGGDFWVFLQRDTDNSTNVWRVNGQTGAVSEPLSDTGMEIVGAGVSTCAPVVFQ